MVPAALTASTAPAAPPGAAALAAVPAAVASAAGAVGSPVAAAAASAAVGAADFPAAGAVASAAADAAADLAAEPVEKVASPLFRNGLHERFASISYEIVGQSFARSVISDAHVTGNDRIKFYSAAISAPRAAALRRLRSETRLWAQCGRRNSLQESFLSKKRLLSIRGAAFLLRLDIHGPVGS